METYLTPRAFHRWSGHDAITSLRVVSPVNFNDMEVVRVMARSRDGTQVPVNIIRRKGVALDGSNPTLLYGYGGYGISMTPASWARRAASGSMRAASTRSPTSAAAASSARTGTQAAALTQEAERVRRLRRRGAIADRPALHARRRSSPIMGG